MLTAANQYLAGPAPASRTFDYIICGAGSSGCVVASRLAETGARILVLEAGGDDETAQIRDPNRWPSLLGTERDWGFTTQTEEGLAGRAIPYNMGRVLGGGSSINVCTWSRGHRADWDFFARESGEPAWNYASVMQLYTDRIEAWNGAPDGRRGQAGQMHVQASPDLHPLASAVLTAAEMAGLPRYPDANGLLMEAEKGCSTVDEIVQDGERHSVYRAYLAPWRDRPNVTILTGATVDRLLMQRHRAIGADCRVDGIKEAFFAEREIVLSLGAINTPRVLMHSGIGDPDHLGAFAIPVVSDLPAVGRHLHDHAAFGVVFTGTDLPLPNIPRSQVASFWKTDDRLDSPDAYAYARGGPALSPQNAAGRTMPAATWSLVVGVRLGGRGRVRLGGVDMGTPPLIDTGFLGVPDDMNRALAALEMARTIGRQSALAPYRVAEFAPADLPPPELEAYLRRGLGTFWHQCGTARMGTDPATSVVDGQLRVHGVDGLRVADAAVLPRVTSGNTMAPCVVVGEMAARFMWGDVA